MESIYNDGSAIEQIVAAGRHREVVGGAWNEVGALQVRFLRAQGLLPHHRLLDVGCGCLRGGVGFVRYLEPEHYFGFDISEALLTIGYDVELGDAERARLPRSHLVAGSAFEFCRFPVTFDAAIAQSLFTHLTFNSIRRCLERLWPVMNVGAACYATFFELPAGVPVAEPYTHPSGVVTYDAQDPYHYRLADLYYAVTNLPWSVRYLGAWGHPKGQHMVAFTRVNPS